MNTDEFIEWLDNNVIGTYTISRDSEKILSSENINFSNDGLNDISRQISFMKNLHTLNLEFNNIRELPKEIINLVNLKKLNLNGNPLTLNDNQLLWIEKLKKNGCEVILPDCPPNSSFTKMFAIDYEREPQFTMRRREIEISNEQYQTLLILQKKMLLENISVIDIKSIIIKEINSPIDILEDDDEFGLGIMADDPLNDPGYSITLNKSRLDNSIYILMEMSDSDCVRGSESIDMEELDKFFEVQ